MIRTRTRTSLLDLLPAATGVLVLAVLAVVASGPIAEAAAALGTLREVLAP